MTSVTGLINTEDANDPSQSLIVSREMSITAEQFSDRLRGVNEGMLDSSHWQQGRYRVHNANGSIEISCRQKPVRYIGSLALTVIEARLDFSAYRATDIGRFVKSFDLAFLKRGC